MRVAVTTFVAVLTIAVQPSAQSQSYITIDPAGSISTSPASISPAGEIAGTYQDANSALHGFLRAKDGTITTIDAPGALDAPYVGTSSAVITPQGLIVGIYTDANYNQHMFLRAKGGTLTNVELPITVGYFYGGFAASTSGAIAGSFFDSNFVPHGFVRAVNGNVTVFDFPPEFLESFFAAPEVTGIDAAGTIVGNYQDSGFSFHGFLRAVDGTMTSFDAPNVMPGIFFGGTNPGSINDSGTIAGFYNDMTQNGTLRGFLLASDGTYSFFDFPQMAAVGNNTSINPSGAVAGSTGSFTCSGYFCFEVLSGFLRTAAGTVSALSYPEAGVQTTVAVSINPSGKVTGNYTDAAGVQHGFLRTP
jgi:hypothetical protein